LLLTRPLVDAGVLPVDYPVTCHGQSGYSGGGKKLINTYENHARNSQQSKGTAGDSPAWTARPYGFNLAHKHLPEMQRYSGLSAQPVFSPSVGDYYQGMLVHVPLHVRALCPGWTAEKVQQLLAAHYSSEPFVGVMPLNDLGALDDGYMSATTLNGTNMVELFVFGSRDQLLLSARLDNLGKGASGAAVQNLNLMLGLPETTGLVPQEPRA
jgi:N-acetyl-gamma-glutamyl-phosphate reductase